MQASRPKIVYNEECIDLRGNFQSTMNKPIKKNEATWHNRNPPRRAARQENNEMVNTALKKLAKTYNSNVNSNDCNKWKGREKEYSFNDNNYRTRFSGFPDANSLKSKSELATPLKRDSNNSKMAYPSSPVIQSTYEKGDFIAKVEPYKNKFTMTKVKPVNQEAPKGGKRLIKDKSLEELIDKLVMEKPSLIASEMCHHHPMWKDRRLMEKYSLLKVPWKRSYTLPVYLTQPSIELKQEFQRRVKECSDKKTYLYDDGSDVDSLFYSQRNIATKQYFGYTFQAQVLTLLNISAYICAILVLSLIVWFVSGNKLFYKLLIQKPPEEPVKKYIKYIGGGIIYSISSILRFIGRIFTIPTQQVFQPTNEYPWPP